MPTVTLGDLKRRTWARLEDNTLFYPDIEVTGAINDAIRALNLFTGFLQTTETLLAQANRPIYDVPSRVLIPVRIQFGKSYLRPLGLKKASLAYRRWFKDTTDNTGQPVEEWIPIGIRKFGIHPASSRGGSIVSVTGVAEPTPLAYDSDTITYPNEFADAVDEYASHQLMIKAGGAVAQQGMLLYQNFLHRMKDLKRYKAKINPRFSVEVDGAK